MNLSAKSQPTDAEKHRFYELAARRYKAECRVRGWTAVIHIENRNDEVFWGKVLHHVYPEGKFHFIAASRSVNGNLTAGCTQALKYREFLDSRFWIAIDSDYRYLSGEANLDARHFILQTYTYSFENHFCYAACAQRALNDACGGIATGFDFGAFLDAYSRAVYPLFVWLLYLDATAPGVFPHNVFHRLLSLPIGGRSLENNGASVIQVLRAHKMVRHFRRFYPDADMTWFEARAASLGLRPTTAYLYVRGHQLYDCVNEQGRKVQNTVRRGVNGKLLGGKSFEHYLTSQLCFGEYDELRRVEADVKAILDRRKT